MKNAHNMTNYYFWILKKRTNIMKKIKINRKTKNNKRDVQNII